MKLKIETAHTQNFVYVVVPDLAAGSRGRYTVHRLALWGAKEAIVIAREQTLKDARRLLKIELEIES